MKTQDYKNMTKEQLQSVLKELYKTAKELCDMISANNFTHIYPFTLIRNKYISLFHDIEDVNRYCRLKMNKEGKTNFYNFYFVPAISDSISLYVRKHNEQLMYSAADTICDNIKYYYPDVDK